MTREKRLVVSLGDIRAVTFECKEEICKARVSVRPAELQRELMDACPSCKTRWWGTETGAVTQIPTVTSSYIALVEALAAIAAGGTEETMKFRLLFEFDEPAT